MSRPFSNPVPTDVILIGASVRAAASSALRAGLTPWCADLFADTDLQRIATVVRVPAVSYPLGLLQAITDFPPAPVIYTGALENHPELIAQVDRPLWGNPPSVLRAVRSPTEWTNGLRSSNLPCPDVASRPRPGRWMLKPIRSAGGFGVQEYAGQRFDPRTHFLQERIDGVPCSGIYVGDGQDARFIGATRQLIGTAWLHANACHYAGSIGPLPLDTAAETSWHLLGSTLTRLFRLRGLFGIDAIVRDGIPWPIEINPRYTASVEVLERSFDAALLDWHRASFVNGTSLSTPALPRSELVCGKGILFAREALAFPDRAFAGCVDLPGAGEPIERGRPVLTLLASAGNVSECETMLQEKAEAIDRVLWG